MNTASSLSCGGNPTNVYLKVLVLKSSCTLSAYTQFIPQGSQRAQTLDYITLHYLLTYIILLWYFAACPVYICTCMRRHVKVSRFENDPTNHIMGIYLLCSCSRIHYDILTCSTLPKLHPHTIVSSTDKNTFHSNAITVLYNALQLLHFALSSLVAVVCISTHSGLVCSSPLASSTL